MSIVREAQETYIEYSSLEFHPLLINTDDLHKIVPISGKAIEWLYCSSSILGWFKKLRQERGMKPMTYPKLIPDDYVPDPTKEPILKFTNLSDNEQKK